MYVAPVVFSVWNAQKSALIRELIEKTTDICLAGDGRCDSPGYSVKYMTYTLMDCDTGNRVSGRVMQLDQESTSSFGMEKVGLQPRKS